MNLKKDFEEFKKDSKEFYKPGRFKEIKGYKVDRWIVRIMIGVLVLLLVVVLAQTGFSLEEKYYYKCPENARGGLCENPFYKGCLYGNCPLGLDLDYSDYPEEFESISNMSLLPAGFEIGEKPPYLAENFGEITALLLVLGVIINHFLHNRDFNKSGVKE